MTRRQQRARAEHFAARRLDAADRQAEVRAELKRLREEGDEEIDGAAGLLEAFGIDTTPQR